MATSPSEARLKLEGCAIWLWHYLHADWQWEQSRLWHEARYALALEQVLDIMQRDPEFMYFLDTASEFYEPLARRLGPRLPELHERVREGRVRIVSAQVANCRPTQVGDETYLRNLQLGRAFFESELPSTDFSCFHSVDVAIGHSQMPQILSQAGFRYYRAWRPHSAMNVRGVPHQFVWEGLDGSHVLVTRGSYGGLYRSDQVPAGLAGGSKEPWDQVVAALYDLQFRDQLLHGRSPSGQVWMIQGCDDALPLRTHDGDQFVDLPAFVAEWGRRESIPLRWCTPLEFSRAVECHTERLPIVQGVLDGADCGYNVGNGGANGLWRWRQMNDRRLLRAEWWSAQAAGIGYVAPEEELRALWREHLTYQAHATEFAFQEDFDELLGQAQHVQYRAHSIEQEALGTIVRTAGGGERGVQYVFNPHPWPLETTVELYHCCPQSGVQSLSVVDEAGRPLAQQVLAELRHARYVGSLNDARVLTRVALPPMGYRRVAVREQAEASPPPQPAPQNGLLEAGDLRLTYRGDALREVRDTTNGVAYSARNEGPWPGLWFHVLDNQGWLFRGPELGRLPFVPQSSAWLQSGPLRWQHRSCGNLGPYQAQVDTLAGERPHELHVRVRLEGHWNEPPTTGFVTLGGDLEAGGQLLVDIPFGVEPRDPDHDYYVHNVPQGVDFGIADMMERLRPGYLWARSWADWSDGAHGVTWFATDGNHYWLKEPGYLGHVLTRCIRLAPGTWEERCGAHLTGAGVHSFDYVLHFHAGNWSMADAQRRAAELRHPSLAVRAERPGPASLPETYSFLELRGPALLSACYRERSYTVVRLYECTGAGGDVELCLPDTPDGASAVDLLGQALDARVRVVERSVYVTLRPWQIATLRLGRPRSR